MGDNNSGDHQAIESESITALACRLDRQFHHLPGHPVIEILIDEKNKKITPNITMDVTAGTKREIEQVRKEIVDEFNRWWRLKKEVGVRPRPDKFSGQGGDDG